MAVVGAASAGAGAIGQNKQAQAQMDAAASANNQQQATMQLQQVQINQAASQEAQARAAQTNRELGKFMAMGGASGVTGVSMDRQQAASGVGEQMDLGILATNRENRIAQSQLQALGIQAKAQSRINQAEASSVGPMQAILGIASGAAGGYASGSQISSQLAGRNVASAASSSALQPSIGPQNWKGTPYV